MKRQCNKRVFAYFLFLIVFASLVAQVSAGVDWVCLNKGEKIEFSKCNTSMRDRICPTTICQYCVNEISDRVYCSADPNLCNQGSANCTYLYDAPPADTSSSTVIGPVLTLVGPTDSSDFEAGAVEFSFKVTKSSQLEKCDLIINEAVAETKPKIIQPSTKLSHTLESGDYTWKIECTQKAAYGGNKTISQSRTLSVLQEIPKLILVSPENPHTISNVVSSQEVVFNYSLSEDVYRRMYSCSLILNDQENLTERNLKLSNEFKLNLSIGTYSWKIFCKENNNINYTSAETRNLILRAPEPPPQTGGGSSGGGGGGGGGGGRSSTIVKAANTTNVTNATINLSAPKNITNATTENKTQEDEVTATEQTNTSPFSRITGAFSGIGKNLKENMLPVIIVIIAIIILVIIFWPVEEAKETANSVE